MNKNKKFYSQPEAELLVIRFEQNIMSVSYGVSGAAGGDAGLDDDDYNYGSF